MSSFRQRNRESDRLVEFASSRLDGHNRADGYAIAQKTSDRLRVDGLGLQGIDGSNSLALTGIGFFFSRENWKFSASIFLLSTCDCLSHSYIEAITSPVWSACLMLV